MANALFSSGAYRNILIVASEAALAGVSWKDAESAGLVGDGAAAVFVSFEHPSHGRCLIDTGYGPDLFEATRRFPWRLLRWFTPIPKRQPFTQTGYLETLKIDPQKIQTVFLSHFHVDHIGGTRLFPESQFVYRSESLDQLNQMTHWKQINDGFVPALLPADFRERGTEVKESSFSAGAKPLEQFQTFDYWGDGSLMLIDLPGHALGHTGYLLNTNTGPMLYVVDAFWDSRPFETGRKLPWLSRHIFHSYKLSQQTNQRLRDLSKQHSLVPLACHCPLTQRLIDKN